MLNHFSLIKIQIDNLCFAKTDVKQIIYSK